MTPIKLNFIAVAAHKDPATMDHESSSPLKAKIVKPKFHS